MPDSDEPLLGSPPAVVLAARFLLPCDNRRYPDDPNWRFAGRWLALCGLVIGLVYAVVFRLSWRWFGEYQYIRWLPAVAVLAVDLGCCGYCLIAGAANVASGRYVRGAHAPAPLHLPALVAIVLVAVAKYALLLSLPIGRWESVPAGAWDQAAWASRLAYFYPQAVYRPLILMPLWGRWAMMLAMSIGRVAPEASARLRGMAGGISLAAILIFWLLAAALTAWYCSGASGYLARGLAIPLGVLLVSYAVSFWLARRADGQTEATTAVAGLAAELAFLCLYVPIASSIYWY